MTNASGAVTDTYSYDAFGHTFIPSGSTPNNYLYRGELYDPDLGLYYLRARYYNPQTGRFLSRDPLDGQPFDPKSLHKYLYAGGDPVNALDPAGRAEVEGYTEINLSAAPRVRALAVGIGDALCVAVAYLELQSKVTHTEDGIPWIVDVHCLARGGQGILGLTFDLLAE